MLCYSNGTDRNGKTDAETKIFRHEVATFVVIRNSNIWIQV